MVKDIAKYNLAERRASYCDRGGRGLSREEGLCVPLYRMLCGINRIWRTGFGNQGLLGILLSSFEKRRESRKELPHNMLAPFSLLSVYECFPQIHCLCTTCMLSTCRSQERGLDPLELELKNDRELPCGCWEPNPGSSARAKGCLFRHILMGHFMKKKQ